MNSMNIAWSNLSPNGRYGKSNPVRKKNKTKN
jgi:hypothetical protein